MLVGQIKSQKPWAYQNEIKRREKSSPKSCVDREDDDAVHDTCGQGSGSGKKGKIICVEQDIMVFLHLDMCNPRF
jgi:hypothetical protein